MMAPLYNIGAAALTAIGLAIPVTASVIPRDNSSTTGNLEACPGYAASNVHRTASGLTASLSLDGPACNAFGSDLQDLTLTVEYQTDTRLHVLIQDLDQQVYQVPQSVFPTPAAGSVSDSQNELQFDYVAKPFSFSVKRRSSGEVLFDTSAAQLIFESQYVRLRTFLPENPSLYGTGEHTDPFMLNTTDYTRIIWNRDAYGTPPGTNLYGDHPVYFDHRGKNGTHAVFLLNSNGHNIKINNTDSQYLEYDLLGGVLDFYFLAGPTPIEVAQQYSEVVGKSAMMPYWGLGFHQCRYGYQDVWEVAAVVANYSTADIPLETMWTDIDYMNLRRVFSLDPLRFPLNLMQQLVSTLHSRQQHYIMMVDPAVAYQDYSPFNDGVKDSAFLLNANGSVYQGVVWPGVTAFPDWFASGTQDYWNSQFDSFFNADSGVNIDALWIDMNEASNFCDYPCTNPEAQATAMGDPPQPPAVRIGPPAPIPGFPADFQPQCHAEAAFAVDATTFFGENILVIGSTPTLGDWQITNAPPLSANNYPIWSATIDVPDSTTFTYQYVRTEPDGSYVYENINRTLTSGACNSTVATNDTITSSSPPQSKRIKRDVPGHTATVHSRQPLQKRAGNKQGLPNRNFITPAYNIHDAAGSLSNKTLDTDLVHANGLVEYDTHNLYGAMMSRASQLAMLSRRPTLRPMVITRSTFAGSGRFVGHWTGDNSADWAHYLYSIAEIMEFNALYQVPMVGADVCGYAGNTNDLLCARWAMLGAFYPFYRNHAESGTIPHEFYRWPIVAQAAQNAIDIRYRLLDYFYTAMHVQSVTGTPSILPMFMVYPTDANTNPLSYQFFFGPGLLVAPVNVENSTSTQIYLPNDLFYDYYTHAPVHGNASFITLTDVPYTSIPLYYKSGNIFAQRIASANTTTELRKQNFELIIAPDMQGCAEGELYLDDGVSLMQHSTTHLHFAYDGTKRSLSITGTFGYHPGVFLEKITVLGGKGAKFAPESAASVNIPLTAAWSWTVA